MTKAAKGKQAVRIGRWAERFCKLRLLLSGWRILEHGFRKPRGTGAGEIDLIAVRGDVLIFVEVKARENINSGLNAVLSSQQHRIIRGAEVYLRDNPHLYDHTLRFDLMIVRPWRWPVHVADAWRP